MRRWLLAPFLVIAILVLSGCSSYVDSDQTSIVPASEVRVAPGHPVGQTFVARHGGLDGIDVWLRALPESQGHLRLHIRESADSRQDLAVSTLPVAAAAASDIQHFAFPPLADSNSRYLYAFIELEGQGEVRVSAAPGAAYRDGSLYRDHSPVADGQVAFRLSYAKAPMLISFGRVALSDLWLLAIAALIYIVPGWALVAWLWRDARLSWAEILGLAAGLGLAFSTIWLLWTDVIGLHLGPLNVWLPVVAGVAALLVLYARRGPRYSRFELRRWYCSDAVWPDVALLVVIGLTFGIRLLVAHALDAPSWGDSVQHAAIGQLIVDHGGLFRSWEPYAPYNSLSVHFGFSAAIAWLAWATHMTSTEATLAAGQLVNGLAILSLYPLATRLAGGKRWAGVAAVLVAGLLSPMPAYYVNWGRFAQLGGQAILPVALWLLLDALDSRRFSWRPVLLAGLVAAGMTLTYYRMPFYYAVFVVAWLIGHGLPHWKDNWRLWAIGIGRLALIGVIIVVLVLPYLSRLVGGNLEANVSAGVADTSPLAGVLNNYAQWRDLATYVPVPLQILAVTALLSGLVRRRWDVVTVGLWTLGLAALVATRLIHLPGANMMDSFAIMIALYIPVGILVGWLASELIDWGKGRAPRAFLAATTVIVVALAGWGAARQFNVAESRFILVNKPDVRAMGWIRQNIPSDARFLVEGFSIWGGQTAVGADAGWWIPIMTQRANTMPPQYALLNEVPSPKDYTQNVVDLVNQLEKTPVNSPESMRLLCEQGVTHIYVGEGQGLVGAGVRQLYSVQQLKDSSFLRPVYHQDRIHIFALDPGACQTVAHE